jgi:hypothetical protein
MKSFFLLSLLIVAACGVKRSSVQPGQTTRAQLLELKGEPLQVEETRLPATQVLKYPEQESYQVQGDLVVTAFLEPEGEERSLLYWKHQFRDCATVTRNLDARELELACPERGQSVVFQEGSAFVKRIIHYAR